MYNGVYLRQAALEAPEHIGRGERQQGILKAVTKKLVKAFFVRGKKQMKQAIVVAEGVKNDTSKRGGFAASQWVLGRYPRRPGSMMEEEEWGQLGVLSYQQDGRTEFGRRAEMRHSAQKAMVNLDTGRRYACLRTASTFQEHREGLHRW